jgi:hypothetical protein
MVVIKLEDLLNLLNVKEIYSMIARKFLILFSIVLLISGCAGSRAGKENDKDVLKSPCIKY